MSRSLGKDITDAQYEDAIARRNAFRSWIVDRIMLQASIDSTGIHKSIVIPSGYMDEFYHFH